MAFYNSDFKTMITASINTVNSLATLLINDSYRMTDIQPIDTSSNVEPNTTTLLVGTTIPDADGNRYSGSVPLEYRRLNLAVLFRGITIRWSTEETTTANFGDWLAETYSIPISNDDFQTIDIPEARDVYLKIPATTNSPWIFGDCIVFLPAGKPDISTIFDESWETGVYTPLPAVDTNYKVSYNFDYSRYSKILLQGENPPNDAMRDLLWHVLFGERESQWDTETKGVLYTGTTAVQAAGGRAGFEYLLIVPRLNAWAHFNAEVSNVI